MAKSKVNKAVTKTKEAAKKAGNYISGNPTTVLYVGLGVLGIYAAYKIVKLFNNVGVGGADDPDAGGGNVDDIQDPVTVPQGATINLATAQILAAEVLNAVDGFGMVEEDEYKAIENVFKGKNAYDYQLISQAFGTPRRSPFTGEESVWWLGGENLNLTQWLSAELDDNQKARLRQAAPLIWP